MNYFTIEQIFCKFLSFGIFRVFKRVCFVNSTIGSRNRMDIGTSDATNITMAVHSMVETVVVMFI